MKVIDTQQGQPAPSARSAWLFSAFGIGLASLYFVLPRGGLFQAAVYLGVVAMMATVVVVGVRRFDPQP
ncbi:MAG: hypothetical protein LC808_13330, partial [Actinobacteria bacterium]|nr:hypothetical protein [Actinomycetota bacterium]